MLSFRVCGFIVLCWAILAAVQAGAQEIDELTHSQRQQEFHNYLLSEVENECNNSWCRYDLAFYFNKVQCAESAELLDTTDEEATPAQPYVCVYDFEILEYEISEATDGVSALLYASHRGQCVVNSPEPNVDDDTTWHNYWLEHQFDALYSCITPMVEYLDTTADYYDTEE